VVGGLGWHRACCSLLQAGSVKVAWRMHLARLAGQSHQSGGVLEAGRRCRSFAVPLLLRATGPSSPQSSLEAVQAASCLPACNLSVAHTSKSRKHNEIAAGSSRGAFQHLGDIWQSSLAATTTYHYRVMQLLPLFVDNMHICCRSTCHRAVLNLPQEM
jgi:hypothetical protein